MKLYEEFNFSYLTCYIEPCTNMLEMFLVCRFCLPSQFAAKFKNSHTLQKLPYILWNTEMNFEEIYMHNWLFLSMFHVWENAIVAVYAWIYDLPKIPNNIRIVRWVFSLSFIYIMRHSWYSSKTSSLHIKFKTINLWNYLHFHCWYVHTHTRIYRRKTAKFMPGNWLRLWKSLRFGCYLERNHDIFGLRSMHYVCWRLPKIMHKNFCRW